MKRIIICVVAISVAVVCVYFFSRRFPHAPRAIVVYPCRDLTPGMRRVGSNSSDEPIKISVNVPEEGLKVHSISQDMPPQDVYVIEAKNGDKDLMEISDGPLTFSGELTSTWPVFSANAEERDVTTASGQVVGKDRWGYLRSGERWRYVRFSLGTEIGYRPESESKAQLWDGITNSACFERKSNSGIKE